MLKDNKIEMNEVSSYQIKRNSTSKMSENSQSAIRNYNTSLAASDKAEKRICSCVYCNKVFQSSSAVKQHETRHIEGKRFSCSHCSKMFTTKGHAKRHEQTHFQDKKEDVEQHEAMHVPILAPQISDICDMAQ